MRCSFKGALLLGLAVLVWFIALAHAAQDLWAACVVFLFTNVLLSIYALRCWRQRTQTQLPIAVPALAVLSCLWLSLHHSYDLETSLLQAWEWTFAFILFYLLFNTLEDANDLKRFIWMSGSVLIPLAAVAFWQQATKHPDSWGRWEIQSTLINSLVLAGFCLPWVFLFLNNALRKKPLDLFLFCSSLSLLALSRSSWAAVCLVGGLFIYYRSELKSWCRHHATGAAMAATVGIILAIALVAKKWQVNVGPYKGSSRLYYWWVALQVWKQDPWTGIGLGGFATAYPFFSKSQFQSTLFAHCFPLQWLSETGILGILSLVIFLGSLFYRRSEKQIGELPKALTASLGSIFLFSLLSINLEYFANQILGMLLLAALVWSHRARGISIKPLWVLVFSICVWMVSPFWLRQFIGSQSYVQGNEAAQSGQWTQAEKSFLNAIAIDPYQADSYHALAMLYWRQYQNTKQPDEWTSSQQMMHQAIAYHRQRAYLAELEFMTGASMKK